MSLVIQSEKLLATPLAASIMYAVRAFAAKSAGRYRLTRAREKLGFGSGRFVLGVGVMGVWPARVDRRGCGRLVIFVSLGVEFGEVFF